MRSLGTSYKWHSSYRNSSYMAIVTFFGGRITRLTELPRKKPRDEDVLTYCLLSTNSCGRHKHKRKHISNIRLRYLRAGCICHSTRSKRILAGLIRYMYLSISQQQCYQSLHAIHTLLLLVNQIRHHVDPTNSTYAVRQSLQRHNLRLSSPRP